MRCKACDRLLSIRNKRDLCAGCKEISVQTLRSLNHEDFRFTEYEGRRLLDPPQGDWMQDVFTTYLNDKS